MVQQLKGAVAVSPQRPYLANTMASKLHHQYLHQEPYSKTLHLNVALKDPRASPVSGEARLC